MSFKNSMNYFVAVIELTNIFLEGSLVFLTVLHIGGYIHGVFGLAFIYYLQHYKGKAWSSREFCVEITTL